MFSPMHADCQRSEYYHKLCFFKRKLDLISVPAARSSLFRSGTCLCGAHAMRMLVLG